MKVYIATCSYFSKLWFTMGNLTAHLCPNTSSKFLAATRRARGRTASETDNLVSDVVPCPAVTDVTRDQLNSSLSAVRQPPHGPKVAKSYVNFPFLTDDEIATWIVNTRFMFILRGPPGAGKSYIAECIRMRFPSAQVCSADNFWFIESGGLEYEYDRSHLAEAHQWCQSQAQELAKTGVSPLVIDNTNVRAWETRFYTDLAKEYGYTIIMVTPQTPWRFDTDALCVRNVHFVGMQCIESKVRNFEHVFPLYYGWQWPGLPSKANQSNERSGISGDLKEPNCSLEDTHRLLNWAWNTWSTVVGIPDIRIQLAAAQGFSDDVPVSTIIRHWCSATTPAFGESLKTSPAAAVPHITAMYSRFGRADGAYEYGISGAVTQNLLGRLFTVQVTGLFFSLRTVGLRIRLPDDELVLHHLWRSDDQDIPPGSVSESADRRSKNEVNGATVKSKRRRPTGCRAHVTLALSSGVSAVETGLDLLRVVDAELDGYPGDHVAIIPGGSVRRVTVSHPALSPNGRDRNRGLQFVTVPPGHDYVYVYDLDTPQHHRVLFSGAY